MSKNIYLKNKTTSKDEPPIELEIETGDRVEDIISYVVSYWDLGDRGDYRAIKNGVELDDTRKISDTDIKDGDILWLLKKGGKKPVYTSTDAKEHLSIEKMKEVERRRIERKEKMELERKRKERERQKEKEKQQKEKELKKREREKQQKRKAVDDKIAERVKEWIESEIGISKYILTVIDTTIEGNERLYILKDTNEHKFEVLVEDDKIKNYRPITREV